MEGKGSPITLQKVVDTFTTCFRPSRINELICNIDDIDPKQRERIKIIGAGFGRTGTYTIKNVLNKIGYNCYHMDQCLVNKDSKLWLEVYKFFDKSKDNNCDINNNKDTINFDVIFGDNNYNAVVDYPACCLYKELCEFYPNAKVLLTVRDFDGWRESVIETIHKLAMKVFARSSMKNFILPGAFDLHHKFLSSVGGIDTFINKSDEAKIKYDEYYEKVINTIPADRLLIFDIKKHGWKELCQFLECDIPDWVDIKKSNSLPRFNSSKAFSRDIDRLIIFAKVIDCIVVIVLAIAMFYLVKLINIFL